VLRANDIGGIIDTLAGKTGVAQEVMQKDVISIVASLVDKGVVQLG